jgi:hypothetical protein
MTFQEGVLKNGGSIPLTRYPPNSMFGVGRWAFGVGVRRFPLLVVKRSPSHRKPANLFLALMRFHTERLVLPLM